MSRNLDASHEFRLRASRAPGVPKPHRECRRSTMPTFIPLPGSKQTLLPNSLAAGPVDKSEIASVTVRVRSAGDPKALAKKAYELEAQHGASQADLDKIEQFAQRHDLMVVHRSAAERSIVLKGTLGDLLAAFPADVQIYHHAKGTYRGRKGEIAIPDDLKGIVTGVFGFDTRPKHRSPRRQHAGSHSGPGGRNGVTATEFATRYKFPDKLDGTGQTIAIIELGGGYRNSDLQAFFQEIKTKMPNVSAISVDHAGNDPTTADSADGEVMLDIEVAGAVAPGANFAVYFAPNRGNKGFIDALNAAVHDSERKPSVISISWGGPEITNDQQSLDAFL